MWELIGLFSFLLVNFYSMRVYTIKAALKTFIFSRISDMFIFMAFVLTILTYNTTDLSVIFLQTPYIIVHRFFISYNSVHFLTLLTLFISIAGAIKGAQFFFHVWLPDAMEAPTPASALIHSSTLVIMGVFLIIRFSIFFEFIIFTNYFLAILGAITIAFGAVVAVFQNDIKKLVAFSTISQIGYLVCGCGFNCYEEVILYLIIHALNKAFLFILVGYIVHFFNGNTDLRKMGAVYLYSFDISVLLLGVCLNLAGLPLTAGFFAKEFLLFQTLKDEFFSLVIRSCWVFSFFFTPMYMFMLVFNVVFSIKKGNLNIYTANWAFKYITFNNLFSFKETLNLNPLYIKYQFSILTSRVTTLILFSFWLFFFFFGEVLILILYNFITPYEFINYAIFFQIKNYFTFNIYLFAATTNIYIFLVVMVLATWSVLYLNFIKSEVQYSYYKYVYLLDIFLLSTTFIFFL